jgi:hypothetical protein
MNTYCSLFYNLNYYLSIVRPDWRCGEGILFKLIEKFNIPCQGIDFIDILRPRKTITQKELKLQYQKQLNVNQTLLMKYVC